MHSSVIMSKPNNLKENRPSFQPLSKQISDRLKMSTVHTSRTDAMSMSALVMRRYARWITDICLFPADVSNMPFSGGLPPPVASVTQALFAYVDVANKECRDWTCCEVGHRVRGCVCLAVDSHLGWPTGTNSLGFSVWVCKATEFIIKETEHWTVC